MNCRLKHFGQGRVRMDYAGKFFDSGLTAYQGTCLLNNVRGMRTIKMAAQDKTGIGCGYNLTESVCLPHRHSLAVCTEE